ncbi:MAG: GerW family sporulation protein [Clostridia bacterium]|nr:GerW family sporulation protein [Clostridia bacterium]
MNEHPIEGLMLTAMNSIQDMVDVNTIIGEPIEALNNTVIIPISKVSFGFAAGGSEFNGETLDEYSKKDKEEEIQYRFPFGGGSGAGVSINPVAFLVVQEGCVKLLPVSHTSAVDKLIDYVPDIIEKVNQMLQKQLKEKTEQIEQTNKIIQENSKRMKTAKFEEKAEPVKPKQKPETKRKPQVEHKQLPKEEYVDYDTYETPEPENDVINIEEYDEQDYDD